MPYLTLVCRWVVALAFFAAGFAKLSEDPSERRMAIQRYVAMSDRPAGMIAAGLPLFEVGIALLLASGVLPAVGGSLAFAVMALLAGLMGWHLIQGRTFDCGCGLGSASISWLLVGRNLALGLSALEVAIEPAGRFAVLQTAASHQPSFTALLSVPMSLILLGLALRLTRPILMMLRSPRQSGEPFGVHPVSKS